MWLRHLPRSRQRGQAAPHSGTRKGVEAGDEQMKDLTLGTPHANSPAASACCPLGRRPASKPPPNKRSHNGPTPSSTPPASPTSSAHRRPITDTCQASPHHDRRAPSPAVAAFLLTGNPGLPPTSHGARRPPRPQVPPPRAVKAPKRRKRARHRKKFLKSFTPGS